MKTSFVSRLAQVATPVSAVALGLLGGVFAQPAQAQNAASAPQPVEVTQPNTESLRLRINNPSQKPIRMRVVHLDNGRLILNETHNEAAYGTLLKFNALPSGRYALVLRVGPERYRYTVQVDSKTPGAATIDVRGLSTRRVDNVVASAAL